MAGNPVIVPFVYYMQRIKLKVVELINSYADEIDPLCQGDRGRLSAQHEVLESVSAVCPRGDLYRKSRHSDLCSPRQSYADR